MLGSKKRGAASNHDSNDDADHGDGESDDVDNVDDDDEGGQDVKVMESLAKKPRCQQMQPNCRYSLAMKIIVMMNMMMMRMIRTLYMVGDNGIENHASMMTSAWEL